MAIAKMRFAGYGDDAVNGMMGMYSKKKSRQWCLGLQFGSGFYGIYLGWKCASAARTWRFGYSCS